MSWKIWKKVKAAAAAAAAAAATTANRGIYTVAAAATAAADALYSCTFYICIDFSELRRIILEYFFFARDYASREQIYHFHSFDSDVI